MRRYVLHRCRRVPRDWNRNKLRLLSRLPLAAGGIVGVRMLLPNGDEHASYLSRQLFHRYALFPPASRVEVAIRGALNADSYVLGEDMRKNVASATGVIVR